MLGVFKLVLGFLFVAVVYAVFTARDAKIIAGKAIRKAVRSMAISAAFQAELDRIDAATTEIADDIDRLIERVQAGDADAVNELKARADRLREIASKDDPNKTVSDAPSTDAGEAGDSAGESNGGNA